MPIAAETIKYGPWTQGVRYDLAAEDIGPNGVRDMLNTRLTQAASVEKVLGVKSYENASAIAGTPTLTACGQFRAPASGTEYVFIVAGTKMYYYNSGWTDITGSVTITAADDNTFQWVRAFDTLILTNGVNPPIKWTGTGNAAALDVDSRFTTAEHVAFFDNRVFCANTNADKDRVWYSDAGDPETWGASSFYNLGSPVTGLQPLQNALAIHTEDFISILLPTGNATIPYQLQQRTTTDPRNPQQGGTLSGRAVVTIPGNAQVFVLEDGVYMWAGGETVEKVSYALDEGYWPDLSKNRLHQSFAVYYADENEVWFWLPNDNTNCNEIMVMSLRHRYVDDVSGQTRFAWYGPLNGAGTTFERNCAGIIDDKPHAGNFNGKLLDHAPAAYYSHEGAAYDTHFETSAPAPLGGDVDLRWLYARTYFDALGAYTLGVQQESQGVGGNTTTLTTTGGGGVMDSFTLGVDAVGTKRMVSKDIDLKGYDPHSSLKFTNNTKDEPYRIRRTHLQFKVIGRHRKPRAGVS